MSTRSACAAITASMSLQAIDVSSIISAASRHSTPCVASARSSTVNQRLASPRLIARAAPCEQAADNPARLPMLPAGGVTTLAVAVMYLSFRRGAITRGFLAAMGLFYVLFAGVLVWLHLQRGVFTGGRP